MFSTTPIFGPALPDIVFQYTSNRTSAVLPTNLFTFLVGSAMIRNTDLVNPTTQCCYLCRDFRLKAEAIFFQIDAVQYLAPENFVTGFNVTEIEVRKTIGEIS